MYPPHHTGAVVVEPWTAPSATAAQSTNEPTPEIFIGRIPLNMPKESLEAHFTPYGATNFRILEGKGCAFCSFSTWAAAEVAVQALNGMKLDAGLGEGINVKFADMKGSSKGKTQQHPKVFIGNIGQQATEDVVREVCQQFGFVTQAKIFARSADAKPCAFVTFTSFSEAELCISALNGIEHAMALEGKVLNCRLADAMGRKTPPSSNGPVTVHPPTAQQLALPVAQTPAVPLPFTPPMGGMGGGQQSRPGTTGGSGPKVFIGGLPDAATEDFVWGMMAPFGEVTEAKIHRKPGAKPCGFARFALQSEADHAISMLGENGRYAVRQADAVRPAAKRPAQMALTGLEGQDAYGNAAAAAAAGGAPGRAVRRLQ